MQTSFRDNDSDELVMLLDGWGMDESPYALLQSSRDVLFVFDYTNTDFCFDFSKYKKIFLVCFSAGVFMAGHLKDILPEFTLKIAINGTLTPGRKNHGVSDETLDAMRNISYETAMDFRKKLIFNAQHLELFNKNQPKRSLQSSLDELDILESCFNRFQENSFNFDKVILGRQDEIIPIENSSLAWTGHQNIRITDGGHFLFYNFKSFDEIIDL